MIDVQSPGSPGWWLDRLYRKLAENRSRYDRLDAYYTGAGEANGVWVGGGAKRLGLDGEVVEEDLQAVLAGLAPGVGGLTPNGDQQHPHPRRVPGFDLTFKAPKSASVLYAVSDDPRVQGAIIDAGEVAMTAAVGWIEREAIRVRRGSHNQAWLAAHGDGGLLEQELDEGGGAGLEALGVQELDAGHDLAGAEVEADARAVDQLLFGALEQIQPAVHEP